MKNEMVIPFALL